ncbi:hypothetical protein GCM10023113_30000 [Cellulomonas oligotrophica]|uniref:Uncharacterized protein n=1 Tax=Cellulomonas oligotrophica TaxID=931536 RepID=A0ABQ4DCM6_9CELL|nr:hypothetical protein Col01nite_26360 [Cellulomonas oligotrophica]
MVALTGSLDVHAGRDGGRVEGERAVVDGVHESAPQGVGELVGSHGPIVPSATALSGPRPAA